MAWPSGKFRTDVQGTVEADVSPPVEGQLATVALPAIGASPPRLLPIPKKGEPNPFDPMKPLGPLPVGGHLALTFDGTSLTFDDSTVATPTTYFAFSGHTEYGQNSNIPFHVTSLDWQESDRLLSAIMTAAGSTTGAIQLGGRGTFDGVMTKSFKDPRIAGRFSGDAHSGVLHDVGPGLGRRRDRKPLHRRDQRRDRRRAGHGVDSHEPGATRWAIRARTASRKCARTSRSATGRSRDLRHGFDLDDWPVDGTWSRRPTWTSTGPTPGCSASGRMQLVDGSAWKEHFDTASGDLTLTGNGISVDRIAMAKGTGRMTGAAVVKWDGTYSFDARGDQMKVESLDNFKVEQAPLTGLLSVHGLGRGRVHGAALRVRRDDQGPLRRAMSSSAR